jgi:DNA-binding response OmpR family regulator
MRNVRLHPADPFSPTGGQGQGAEGQPQGPGARANRLNLLLSYAGWDETPWVDRLPPLLDPMGIQSHRAQDAREASRVIESTPIHVAVVDLALPLECTESSCAPAEEAGPRILDLLSRLRQPPPILVIKRGRTSRDDRREMSAALRLGAFAVLDRPRAQQDLETLLELLRRVLTRHYRNTWPQGPIPDGHPPPTTM